MTGTGGHALALCDRYLGILLLLLTYDHALDPESGPVDEVGGCHQVCFGARREACHPALSRLASAEVLLLPAGAAGL